MTIHAQLPHRPRTGHRSSEHPTAGPIPRQPAATDAFSILDHRTRGRTIRLGAAPPGRYLSVERGDEIHLIPLDQPIVHLGRGLAADIRLEDPHVSRRHAIIAQRRDGVRVLDDRSGNGTFVNGRPVTVAYLRDGDVLRLGRAVLRLVEIEPQRRTPPLRRIALPIRVRRPLASRPVAGSEMPASGGRRSRGRGVRGQR